MFEELKAKENLHGLGDEEVVKILVKLHPHLAHDAAFMEEIISKDIRNIIYDKTDSPMLYKKLFKQAADLRIEAARARRDYQPHYIAEKIENIKQELDSLIQEIDNPKQAPEGKYKIPQKYLFETVRNLNHYSGDVCSWPEPYTDAELAGVYFGHALEYLYYDCKLPQEYGEKMEALYNNPDRFVLYHVMQYNLTEKEYQDTTEVRKKIYTEGLRNAQNDKHTINATHRTMRGAHQTQFSFVGFLAPSSKIILSVPQSALAKGNQTPMWGGDKSIADQENPGYVLPEYVVGAVTDSASYKDQIARAERKSMDFDGVSFEPNFIPLEQRKQYPYKFVDMSTVAVSDAMNQDPNLKD